MGREVAVVYCVHHKPWLIMSTLLTALVQDHQESDFYILHNVGDGACRSRASYQEYHALAARYGQNGQLSVYDKAVREVCRIKRDNVYQIEYENDHGLDSGAFYKFIRGGMWEKYAYLFFIGEGTLFARTDTLSSILRFSRANNVHFVASGHEKRRLPKRIFMSYNTRPSARTVVDDYHDRMIKETFRIFCRNTAFKHLFEAWSSDFCAETQNHVPDIWSRNRVVYRLRTAANRAGINSRGGLGTALRLLLRGGRRLFAKLDSLDTRGSIFLGDWLGDKWDWQLRARETSEDGDSWIHVNGVKCKIGDIVPYFKEGNARFHQVKEPEWYGCAVVHMVSREFLACLADRLNADQIYDVLELPFCATALEVIWGFLPAWLGYEKWFTDGFHRVRKNFITHRREDDPEGMASYINRYHRGSVCVGSADGYLKVKATRRNVKYLENVLTHHYF